MLHGIESDIVVDASVERLAVGERSLAKTHIEALGGGGRKPAIIRDCGHPSKDFIKRSQDKEIKYAMRTRKKLNPRIRPYEKRRRKEARALGEREPRGGALNGRLVGMLITDDSFAGNHLYRELASETRRRAATARTNREAARKAYLRKPRFHLWRLNSTANNMYFCTIPNDPRNPAVLEIWRW
jgi:hypothetical protein